MKNLTKKVKFCWVATETRKGWRVAAAVGNRNYNLSGLVLSSREDVGRLLERGSVVFVHLKDSTTVPN